MVNLYNGPLGNNYKQVVTLKLSFTDLDVNVFSIAWKFVNVTFRKNYTYVHLLINV